MPLILLIYFYHHDAMPYFWWTIAFLAIHVFFALGSKD